MRGGEDMPRHSFIRLSKLTDVRGRIDYISNPRRQEHLYASYNTAGTEFWKYLSEQSQLDFRRSNQKNGKCIEAGELIIALPESLQSTDPDSLLRSFTEAFREKYGMQCAAALHHNKSMTNYHIHLVFSERDMLDKKEVKIAARNMFYDESGRHVRTKKEILDENGKVRSGCSVIAKGDIYEIKWFSARKDIFKSKGFLSDVKDLYTDLINRCVTQDTERQQVFDASGPYLATRKIGKNNPLADVIVADNRLRQEWNQTVDQVLIAGGTQEEVAEFKRDEITEKVAASVRENGYDPGLFSELLRMAIAVLKEFLEILMGKDEEEISRAKPADSEQTGTRYGAKAGPDINIERIKTKFVQMDSIHQKLNKCNRKIFALQKQKQSLADTLDLTPKSIFHRKERKAIIERMDGLQRQIDQTRSDLEAITRQHGFDSVRSAEAAYKAAKAEWESVQDEQGSSIGVKDPAFQPQSQKQKVSLLKKLAEKQMEVELRESNHRGRQRGRKERIEYGK